MALSFCAETDAGLKIEFDYSFESQFTPFFNNTEFGDEAKETLELAARIVNRYVDNLEPIVPDGENGWSVFFTDPGGSWGEHEGWTIPADTIKVIVGGDQLLDNVVAESYSGNVILQGSAEWQDNFRYRGQSGAAASPYTDYATWGGIIYFNRQIDWHVGATTEGLTGTEKYDLLSVAAHELMHLMGVGPADSWQEQIGVVDDPEDPYDGYDYFDGPESKAVGSSNNPQLLLDPSANPAHFNDGVFDGQGEEQYEPTLGVVEGLPQEALMNPAFSSGERRLPTTLDRALLRDVGWVEALPSDANLDGRFDFEDLVQIFSTGGPKYSDGDNQNTTWDEGDFDDDFDFEFEDLILAFGTYGQYYGDPLPYGAEESLAEQGGEAAAEVALVYDARSGNLALESGGNQLSTIAIESAGEMLLASAESQSLLGGLADVNSSEIFGKLDPSGISDLDFGAALPAGLTRAMLADDLTVNGSLVGGGFVGGYSLVYVPEPGTLALAFAGLILLLLWKQRYA